ncbi:MAG: ABC transporter ATP-binding protein [Clostridiales bacterium]|nr:ABC transporter ATP-binding protein [Clostridiales bacterium]
MTALVEMKDLKKTYKMGETYVKALDGINLTIKKDEFVSIVGPSGSGKSTLMNMIGCLDALDEGTYFLEGTDVSELSSSKLALIRSKKIGFIFQGFNLLSKLTALENVEMPLIYQNYSHKNRKKKAIEALEKVGLGDRLHHKPTELSGGQQQRVAIARALVADPPIILADEPTGNLDSKSGKEIMDMLVDLHKQGNTIILITHDTYIANTARRKIVLKDGKITEDVEVS